MMEGITGSRSSAVVPEAPEPTSQFTPPSGEPAGAPEAQPDVAVAISDAASARLDAMMTPAEHSNGTMQVSDSGGGINFGVEMGGFDWPLNAQADSTVANQSMEENGWRASSEATAQTGVAESGESAYLALGKSSVNAAE